MSRWDPKWESGKPKVPRTIYFTARAVIGHVAGPGIQYDDSRHASVVLDRLLKLYGQEGERSFYVDSGTAINDEVDVIQFAGCYTAKGANSDDVRKKIVAAARYHGRFLDEKLEVTIRTTSY
jgi:hypothetical protein